MSDIWGDLPKSQIDPTTVDEEIDEKIQTHMDDPDAHIETGQSLQSHKASEIIDHIARSVVRDKLGFDRFQIDDHFSTIDAWENTAGVILDTLGQVSISTTDVLNNVQNSYAMPLDAMPDGGKPQNSPVWQARLKFEENSNQEIYFGQFDLDVPGGVGFKIVNANLYAFYIDDEGTEQTTQISGYTINDIWYNFRYEITAGYVIKYYINDTLVHTYSTVTLTSIQMFAHFRIKTTTTAQKIMYIQQFHFDEDYTT